MRNNVRDKKFNRRSGLVIMGRLLKLIRNLLPVIALAVLFGVLGYLSMTAIPTLAMQALLKFLQEQGKLANANFCFKFANVNSILGLMVIVAVLRGFLHYAEQYCNHYIAFKILALIRHRVFIALRRLCPAKLEVKERGNLISVLTSDIELLEVFYAHTISPIAICIIVCTALIVFFAYYHWSIALLALLAYLFVGVVIPLVNSKLGNKVGVAFREQMSDMNSFVLESLRGIEDIMMLGYGEKQAAKLSEESNSLKGQASKLTKYSAWQKTLTLISIFLASCGNLLLTINLYQRGSLGVDGIAITSITLMSSFAPTIALANLSNSLNLTFASGERVLSLLDEQAVVDEVEGEIETETFENMLVDAVSFSYGPKAVLTNCTLNILPKQIIGIYGPSGCGKSTFLKLLMRFWDVKTGAIYLNKRDLREYPTSNLRKTESYISQDTQLFKGTIRENIAIAKMDASLDEIESAAKKAAIHDFIMSLSKGYDTELEELGAGLSGGQRQRIGLARAFLHDSELILLDEPTSNLDALNEGLILKKLKEEAKTKTIVLVSHRESTLRIADKVVNYGKA